MEVFFVVATGTLLYALGYCHGVLVEKIKATKEAAKELLEAADALKQEFGS